MICERYRLFALFVVLALLGWSCTGNGVVGPPNSANGYDGDCINFVPRWSTETDPAAVTLHFSARDCDTDSALSGISLAALEIREGGIPVGADGEFRELSSDKIRPYVILLVDGSDAGADGAKELVDSLLGHGATTDLHVGLAAGQTDGTAQIVEPPILDANALHQRIDSLRSADEAEVGVPDFDSALPALIDEFRQYLRVVHERNHGGAVPAGHLVIVGPEEGAELSDSTTDLIDESRRGGIDVPSTPAVQTWSFGIDSTSPDLGTAWTHHGTASGLADRLASDIESSHLLTYCSPSRGGEISVEIAAPGANGNRAVFSISTDGFADGCSASFFDTSCDGRECGGLHCGACSDTTEICGDPEVGECVYYCLDVVACEGQIIETDLGHEMDCFMGPTVTTCDDKCVDLDIDEEHCGECGLQCTAPGSECVGGTCRCPDGSYDCGGDCVNLLTDTDHCGQCGNSCPDGISCVDGTCPCDGDLVACGGQCVDTSSSLENCGGCGIDCQGYDYCDDGICRCSEGRGFCDGACVDLFENDDYCGGCNNSCDADKTCDNAQCVCLDDGEAACGVDDACIDVTANDEHCGNCDNACDEDQHCQDGDCICDDSQLTVCDGECVDTQTDIDHCGDCGDDCGANQYCEAGVCVDEPVLEERQITAGTRQSCVLETDGTAVCWGSNDNNESATPFSKFVQLSSGDRYNCGVRTDGLVHCWGRDMSGEAFPPGGIFKQVSAGWGHTCGVDEDDEVQCWGNSEESEPGSFEMVSVNWNHSCGLLLDGSIQCWGSDNFGKTDVPPGSYTSVSAGFNHTCALRTDDTITCWGAEGSGQSDDPSGTFQTLSAGGSHSCGIRTDGTIHCWGDNSEGQLDSPGGQFIDVAAGYLHSCGIDIDDEIHCWGDNEYGQSSPE